MRNHKPFQFPSNGKDFPNSKTKLNEHDCILYRFQFPSNGKDFPNEQDSIVHSTENVTVSIPFKREGLSELTRMRYNNDFDYYVVSIPFKREGLSELKIRDVMYICNKVSIPFKREGLSELRAFNRAIKSREFQFPSNGKDFPNVIKKRT